MIINAYHEDENFEPVRKTFISVFKKLKIYTCSMESAVNVCSLEHISLFQEKVAKDLKGFWGTDNLCDECKWPLVKDLEIRM